MPPSLAASLLGSSGATHSTDIKQFTAAKAPKSDQQFAAVEHTFTVSKLQRHNETTE
jgi:hypothetical protein